MSNKFLSAVFKVAGIVYAVLVGGIALLMLIFSFGSYADDAGMGIILFLVYASAAFVALTIFWGLSNALSDLDDLRNSNNKLLEQNRKILRALKALGAPDCDETPSRYSLSEISSGISENAGTWECPECGRKNPCSQRNCKDCGYQR